MVYFIWFLSKSSKCLYTLPSNKFIGYLYILLHQITFFLIGLDISLHRSSYLFNHTFTVMKKILLYIFFNQRDWLHLYCTFIISLNCKRNWLICIKFIDSVMYVVDLRRAVYYQKCHDPDCRGAGQFQFSQIYLQ